MVPYLNKKVDFFVRANYAANPMYLQAGLLLIGNNGLEFRSEKGKGYIQIPWESIDHVRVQLFFNGRYVRGFHIITDTDQQLEFIISKGRRVLKVMRKYLNRSQFVVARGNLTSLFKKHK